MFLYDSRHADDWHLLIQYELLIGNFEIMFDDDFYYEKCIIFHDEMHCEM